MSAGLTGKIGGAAMLSLAAASVSAGSLTANFPEGEGTLRIDGVMEGRGVSCPRFRLLDGRMVSLAGRVPDATEGTRLVLTGRWATVSGCMQGRTFFVSGGEDR